MDKKLRYTLGILFTIIIACILYFYMCCIPCAEEEANSKLTVVEEEIKLPEATYYSFKVQDNSSGLQFTDSDNFRFKRSEFQTIDSVSVSLNGQLERLTEYLNNNPNKNVEIIGLYRSNEDNMSVFPNLGVARANSVKNYFVSHGISPKSLTTSGLLDDALIPDNLNILHGPVIFKVSTVDSSQLGDGSALKDTLNSRPLVLYFKTGAKSLSLSKDQRQKVHDLLNYVEKYDAKLQVTGHTDNTGDRESNIKLALERAKFIKKNLVINGIIDSYITTDSKGPDLPIADNSTEKGRAENRRVEININ
jgi:outer membrane protein OmpA-like peptidoglycan-associated protein